MQSVIKLLDFGSLPTLKDMQSVWVCGFPILLILYDWQCQESARIACCSNINWMTPAAHNLMSYLAASQNPVSLIRSLVLQRKDRSSRNSLFYQPGKRGCLFDT